MIKARTMFEMVEEVELPGGPCKLLFLSNVQCDLLGSSDHSLQKMLDALEIPKPQLVINLLQSWGFADQLTVRVDPMSLLKSAAAGNAGLVANKGPPFLTPEEEREAEERIDQFMADVLIPLAAQVTSIAPRLL